MSAYPEAMHNPVISTRIRLAVNLTRFRGRSTYVIHAPKTVRREIAELSW